MRWHYFFFLSYIYLQYLYILNQTFLARVSFQCENKSLMITAQFIFMNIISRL